jgi:hypothetical protein
MELEGTLVAPERGDSIPASAQWISGEGKGIWFLLSIEQGLGDFEYRIRRYLPDGTIECDRVFRMDMPAGFNFNHTYKFIHISHCLKCRVAQKNNIYVLHYVREYITDNR